MLAIVQDVCNRIRVKFIIKNIIKSLFFKFFEKIGIKFPLRLS